ncbi:cytochrome C oxidase copper chaperone-domain-containing protein [Mycena metata]|uniref:Cytochrome C oxidase copper chaperone-domain-containing protein n=2 Tax=Mycena TaxID=41247 RepID=A0AAD7N2S1_9AGAR|nr:cytochrome C oxidase copper chaperone-domain-containing protein [Mycena alexandri]KAJ7743174.1 cytochrome C oxidase copper chaperone-domain-containing protein [Mycena metata]
MFEKITSLWSSTPAAPPYDPTNPKLNPLNPEGLKPCCACPQTKSARDDCFLNTSTSEADDKCKQLVENHLACMRSLGFKL